MSLIRNELKLAGNIWALSQRMFISQRTATTVAAPSTLETAKPYSEIPLVKGYPLIGSTVEFLSNTRRLHELLHSRVEEYGPVYREQLGLAGTRWGQQMVFTANPDDWQNILYGEVRGTPAGRMKLWSLDAYSKTRGISANYFNLEGRDFEHAKEGVKPLLMPKNIAKMVPDLCQVTDDLTERIAAEVDDNGLIQDIRDIIHRWTFECGGMVVFKTRFGLLMNVPSDPFSAEMLNFYNHARIWFDYLSELELGSPIHRTQLTRTWKDFVRTFDKIYEYSAELYHAFGEHIVNPKVEYEDIDRITHAQIVTLASADTTAHSAIWILIELSYNPEVQERLFEEINANSKGSGEVNLQIPYLRGFLKEMFRIRPLTNINQKILTEDLLVSGYHVPAGRAVNMLLHAYDQNEWFDDAETVRPQRWYRGEKGESVHPFAVLPFGHGQRSCLGRRIAENELLIFISKVVKRFKVSPVRKRDEIRCKTSLFVVPNSDVTLKFEERQ